MELFGILNIPNFLLVAAIFWLTFYLYGRKSFNFYHGLGLDGPKPTAYFGNLKEIMELGFAHVFMKWHKEFGVNYRMFWGSFPNVVTSDPEIIEEILIKRFSNFTNRRLAFPLEDITNKMVSFAKDDHWKYLRVVLSPSYSSKKMREMTPLIQETFKNLEKSLRKNVGKETNLTRIFSASALDVIATTGFGIQVNSLENPNSPLVKNVAMFFGEDIFKSLQLIATVFPFTAQILYWLNRGVFFYSLPYFVKFCKQLFKERKQEKYAGGRKDLLQLMLDAQIEGHEKLDKNIEEQLKLENITDWRTKRGLTDEEIIAQCIIFLVAGYDSSTSTLSFFTRHMALYPDVQEKLYQEITEILGEERANYDNVQKLTYLDMCISETLRLYPIGFILTRETREDCTIKGLKIPKDSGIIVSTMALHRDPKYWSEPNKFDPERFNEENKAKIKPFTYLPFGDGPRVCPGRRLAMLELKMVISEALRKFRFVPSENTEKIEFAIANILKPKGGVWAKVELRE